MDTDTNALVHSILENLQRILNARRGNAAAQMDFGIPAPSDITHNFPEAVGNMQKVIREAIEKFEPRLTDIRVIHIECPDDILTLRYQITAKVASKERHIPVSFDTLINSGGHISLES